MHTAPNVAKQGRRQRPPVSHGFFDRPCFRGGHKATLPTNYIYRDLLQNRFTNQRRVGKTSAENGFGSQRPNADRLTVQRPFFSTHYKSIHCRNHRASQNNETLSYSCASACVEAKANRSERCAPRALCDRGLAATIRITYVQIRPAFLALFPRACARSDFSATSRSFLFLAEEVGR